MAKLSKEETYTIVNAVRQTYLNINAAYGWIDAFIDTSSDGAHISEALELSMDSMEKAISILQKECEHPTISNPEPKNPANSPFPKKDAFRQGIIRMRSEGHTVNEVGEAFQISPSYVSKICRGKV